MRLNIFCPTFAGIAHIAASPKLGIRVENLTPSSSLWNANAIRYSGNRRKVEYAKNNFAASGTAQETQHGIVNIVAGNPFKAVPMMVYFPKGTFRFIQCAKGSHHIVQAVVNLKTQQMPIQRMLLFPLLALTKLAAHEQKFFCRDAHT